MGLKTYKQTFRKLNTIEHIFSIGRINMFVCAANPVVPVGLNYLERGCQLQTNPFFQLETDIDNLLK
jgi:hypothetical protein